MDPSEIKSIVLPYLGEEIAAELQSVNQALLDRRQDTCVVVKGGSAGDSRRLRDYSLAHRQVLLHRAIGTFAGAIVCFRENLVYSMTLSVRGNFETTAAMGYLWSRLNSAVKGNISREAVDEDIYVMMLGTRNKIIPEAPEAKQILTLFEHAEKAVRTVTFGGEPAPEMLTGAYKYLCEFCHPNYHSNSVASRFDADNGRFCMRHNGAMSNEEAEIVENLLISARLLLDLYDNIPVVLELIDGPA